MEKSESISSNNFYTIRGIVFISALFVFFFFYKEWKNAFFCILYFLGLSVSIISAVVGYWKVTINIEHSILLFEFPYNFFGIKKYSFEIDNLDRIELIRLKYSYEICIKFLDGYEITKRFGVNDNEVCNLISYFKRHKIKTSKTGFLFPDCS